MKKNLLLKVALLVSSFTFAQSVVANDWENSVEQSSTTGVEFCRAKTQASFSTPEGDVENASLIVDIPASDPAYLPQISVVIEQNGVEQKIKALEGQTDGANSNLVSFLAVDAFSTTEKSFKAPLWLLKSFVKDIMGDRRFELEAIYENETAPLTFSLTGSSKAFKNLVLNCLSKRSFPRSDRSLKKLVQPEVNSYLADIKNTGLGEESILSGQLSYEDYLVRSTELNRIVNDSFQSKKSVEKLVSEVQKLEADLDSYKRSAQNSKSRLSRLEREKVQIANDKANLPGSIANLRSDLEVEQQLADSLKTDVSLAESAFSRAQRTLESVQSGFTALIEKVERLESKLSSEESLKEELASQINQKQSSVNNLGDRLDNFNRNNDLQGLRNDLANEADLLNSLEATFSFYDVDRNGVITQFDRQRTVDAKLDNHERYNQALNRRDVLGANFSDLQERIGNSRGQLRDLKASRKPLERQLNSKNAELSGIDTKISQLNNAISANNSTINGLPHEIQQIKNDRKSWQNQFNIRCTGTNPPGKPAECIGNLQANIDRLTAEIASLEQQKITLAAQNVNNQKQIGELMSKKGTLPAEIARIQSRIDASVTRAQTIRANVETMQADVRETQNKLDRVNNRIEEIASRVSNNVLDEISEFESQYNSVSSSVTDLENRIESLVSQREQLRRSYERSQNELEVLNSRNSSLANSINQTQNELNNANERLSDLKSSEEYQNAEENFEVAESELESARESLNSQNEVVLEIESDLRSQNSRLSNSLARSLVIDGEIESTQASISDSEEKISSTQPKLDNKSVLLDETKSAYEVSLADISLATEVLLNDLETIASEDDSLEN